MRFFHDNKIDVPGYGLSASSEAGNYPVSNLRDYQLSKHWRSTGKTSEWVKIDGGASGAIAASFAFVAGHNISAGAAAIRIQGNDTDVWTAPEVDQAFSHSAGLMWGSFASRSLRYWRFLIEDSGNPAGYIRIGRVGVGQSFDLSNWAQAEFPRRKIDTSVVERSVTGQIYGDLRITYLEYDFDFPHLNDMERQNLEAMWDDARKVKPIVLVPNPGDSTIEPLYCSISTLEISHRIAYRWRGRMTVTEAL